MDKFHVARWVLPISSLPIQNGYVLVRNDKIISIGNRSSFNAKNYKHEIIDHGNSIIMPGLINAHCHLELSSTGYVPFESDFGSWVERTSKIFQNQNENEKKEKINQSISEIINNGTVGLGDITNSCIAINSLIKSKLKGVIWIELINFLTNNAEAVYIQGKLQKENIEYNKDWIFNLTPHSIYSCSKKLINLINDETNLLSIHCAESKDENEFLQKIGSLCELLKKRNRWEDFEGDTKDTPVSYLNRLGVLRRNTILVHCVKIKPEDINLIARTKSTVCICPRSNGNLLCGAPPLLDLLEKNINVIIGTDSLASNKDLNLFEELRYLKQKFPKVDSHTLFEMGTFNAAKTLCLDDEYGTLEIGKASRFLIIKLYGYVNNPYDFLMNSSVLEIKYGDEVN